MRHPREGPLSTVCALDSSFALRTAPDFTFIDLFAGIGGLRQGFEAIGGECIFSSEWDRFCQTTYEANYGDEHVFAGDITKIKSDEVPPHDLLLAGFPCQPFSLAGVSKKNALNRPHGFRCGDPRYSLLRCRAHPRASSPTVLSPGERQEPR